MSARWARRFTYLALAAAGCGDGAGIRQDNPTESKRAAAACLPAEGELLAVCPGRGLYDGPVTIVLATRERATVAYTLDGTFPDATNGTRYTGAFEIRGTPEAPAVMLRARVIGGDHPASPAETHSYVFPDAVIRQTAGPTRFPNVWVREDGKQKAGDYEMDPDILGSTDAVDRARKALRALPTLSLVLPSADLWDKEKGIYVNSEGRGREWERAASMELIAPGPEPGFQIDCGLRIQGGSSREDWRTPKQSMRVVFRNAYGAGSLDYPLFGPSPVDRFDNLILDAHLNYTWLHPDEAIQRERGDYVRDSYTSDIQRAAGKLATRHRFVLLYLNGLFWGLYDLHERPDEHFAASHLGGDAGEWDVIKHFRPRPGSEDNLVSGNLHAWDRMMAIVSKDLRVAANYDALSAILDLDAFIDYILGLTFVGMGDWDHQNWYVVGRRASGGKFQFVSWDAEKTIRDVTDDITNVDRRGGPNEIFHALSANDAFWARYQARATELLNGPFSVGHSIALFNRRISEVRPAILLESARWGDHVLPTQPYTERHWQAEVDRLVTQFFSRRTEVVRTQVKNRAAWPPG